MNTTVTLRYNGRKPYLERQGRPLGNRLWQPGDVFLVSQRAAAKLLGFIEFERIIVDGANQQKLSGEARAVLETEAQRQAVLQEKVRTDAEIGLSVQMMDKEALEQLARSHGVEIDKRRSLENLRQQVAVLVQS